MASLGIIGGGQLAKMMAQAALTLGLKVVILERDSDAPALRLTDRSIIGNWDDPKDLMRLAKQVDVVTLENEFVDYRGLRELERRGYRVVPSSQTIEIVQDKLFQKRVFRKAGLKVPEFKELLGSSEVTEIGHQWGWPVILKKRRNGYDGKGNVTVLGASETQAAWKRLEGERNALYAEAYCDFKKELAVIVTRDRRGKCAIYPVVDTIQKDHICHCVKTPAKVPETVARRAAQVAAKAVEAVQGVGTYGLELFLMKDGDIWVNEMAPRVHNSGHYTLEACECSQFENHVRAVMRWPLGSPRMRVGAAVMFNLLAQGRGEGFPWGVEAALKVDGAHLHLYGKRSSRPGRKMGHVTACGSKVSEAFRIAQRAAMPLRFGRIERSRS